MLSIMATENNISPIKNSNYFTIENTEHIENKRLFNKYLNWLSAEFELYLQEQSNGLKIYFPGGWLAIQNSESKTDYITFKTIISSKNKEKGLIIKRTADSILSHIKTMRFSQS